jgi:NTP pyrophosphatase (non-canonical NTP hydrolase)
MQVTLQELQAYIRQKDHKPELAHAYFLKLSEEVGELARALRKDLRHNPAGSIKGTIAEELYDVLYYTVALANIYGVDLTEAMRRKEELNAAKYGQPPARP